MKEGNLIIQKAVAMLLVFIVLIAHYGFLSINALSYAIDMVATNNSNVQFKAYFKSNEEEISTISSEINSENLKLNIDVAVRNEGYLKDGQIYLENAGFKIKKVESNSSIKKIENNVIYLNQINAEELTQIEVDIEYLDSSEIEITSLNRETTVKLKGTYTNSKREETIQGESKVSVDWNVPKDAKALISGTLLTNSKYIIDEETKRVVQILVESNISNNAFPVKNTTIQMNVPEEVQNVEVHKRTTKATNGDKEFIENNYSVDNNVLTISVNNEAKDDIITWNKNAKDIYVVTYELPENVEIANTSIKINGKIETYDINEANENISIDASEQEVKLDTEKQGIATINQIEAEGTIYKGKIYSGEDREYTSYTNVQIDYVKGLQKIEVNENEPVYIAGNEEKTANIKYKEFKINKEKVAQVLGNTWEIKVGERSITNETQADEEGNIAIQLEELPNALSIEISKPENNGILEFITTKVISKTEYSRSEIKEFTKIKDGATVKYTKNNVDIHESTNSFNISLLETASKVNFSSSQNTLTETEDQQQIDLKLLLETNGENRDLFKKPVIKITLPKEIKTAKVAEKNIIFGNGLEFGEVKVESKNSLQVIEIKLNGEQKNYLVDGTQINLKVNVELNDIIENVNDYITLNYTNENATTYADNGQQKLSIDFIAKKTNTDTDNTNIIPEKDESANFNVELKAEVAGKAIKSGDEVKSGEIITYTAIISDITKDMQNVSFEATIPDNTTLVQINPNYLTLDEYEAFIRNDNYFAEKTERTIKQQNLKFAAGKTAAYKYMVRVNTNLTQTTETESKVTFKNGDKEKTAIFRNKLSNASLRVTLMPVYRTGTETLTPNYDYGYYVEIKNLTNIEQKNIAVTINNNPLINIKEIKLYNGEIPEELESTNNTFTIDTISANSSMYCLISGGIKQYTDNLKYAQMSITTKDNSGNIYRSNLLSEEVEGVRIAADLKSTSTNKESGYLKEGDKVEYTITLKNTGTIDADELEIRDHFSDYLELESVMLNGSTCKYVLEEEYDEEEAYNTIRIDTKLAAGKQAIIKIKAKVREGLYSENDLKVINKTILYNAGLIAETEENVYTIRKENLSGDSDSSENSKNQNQDGNSSDNSYSISGTIWNDANKDGSKDMNEDLFEGIKVYAINAKTSKIAKVNNQEVVTETDRNGFYSLDNLPKGKYIVAFEFNTEKYTVTAYQAEGVAASNNSDAVLATKNINGENRTLAFTDVLNINQDITDIDLGLSESKVLKLEVQKSIDKIVVTNSEGTKIYNYDDTNIAKTEIASKNLDGSKVVIEYKIKIKNTGEVAGYAKSLVDHIPSSLSFNSSLNKEWYKKGKNIYNTSIINEKIEPGEEKEVKLILTKKMTASNTGLINNKAEIESTYGTSGTSSSNAQALSSADAIITVKTGAAASYVTITLTSIIVILGMAYLINKYILMKNIKI